MNFIKLLFWIIISISGTNVILALPINNDSEHDCGQHCVNYASQVIAINLLKSNNDIDGNQVYSPLGISAILALLAEASNDAIYEEFVTILHYPPERKALRQYYKILLADYQNRITSIASMQPYFQNWLYIYRNFSVREVFRDLARKYYYVDVKDVNREDYYWNNSDTSLNLDDLSYSTTITHNNSKDVVGFETLKYFKIENEVNDVTDKTINALDLSGTTSSAVLGYTDNYVEKFIEKETSKFDRYVSEDQYVPKPQIFEKIEQHKHITQTQQSQQQLDLKQQIENPHAENVYDKLKNQHANPVIGVVCTGASSVDFPANRNDLSRDPQAHVAETSLATTFENSNEAKSVQLTKVDGEKKNSLQPLEKLCTSFYDRESLKSNVKLHTSRNFFGKRSVLRSGDVASALSANSIKSRELEPQTKALLFNGLYFRGNWDKTFVESYEQNGEFYMTAEDTIKVTMMHFKGEFGITELAHLNVKVLHLPYQNEKYSLIIFLPNELEGIHDLVDKLHTNDFALAKSQIMKRPMHVALPKLQIEETSHSESMLKHLGLRKIFSQKEADLNALSGEEGLTVDEIVQFVSIRFDDHGENSTASLSPTSEVQRQNQAPRRPEVLEVNHPFLYFLIDCEHDFILVSGKVFNPELPEALSETLW